MREDDKKKQVVLVDPAVARNTASPGDESIPNPRQNDLSSTTTTTTTTTTTYGMAQGRNGDPNSSGGGEGAGAGRSALISDLVAQLKRGEITKTDLFARLQHLQGAGATRMGVATGAASAQSPASSTKALPSLPSSLPAPAAVAAGQASGASPTSSREYSVEAADPGGEVEEAAGFFSAVDRQVCHKQHTELVVP